MNKTVLHYVLILSWRFTALTLNDGVVLDYLTSRTYRSIGKLQNRMLMKTQFAKSLFYFPWWHPSLLLLPFLLSTTFSFLSFPSFPFLANATSELLGCSDLPCFCFFSTWDYSEYHLLIITYDLLSGTLHFFSFCLISYTLVATSTQSSLMYTSGDWRGDQYYALFKKIHLKYIYIYLRAVFIRGIDNPKVFHLQSNSNFKIVHYVWYFTKYQESEINMILKFSDKVY